MTWRRLRRPTAELHNGTVTTTGFGVMVVVKINVEVDVGVYVIVFNVEINNREVVVLDNTTVLIHFEKKSKIKKIPNF